MTATERFLARLGCGRDEFVREHFAAAWPSYERLTTLCTAGRIHAWRERSVSACRVSPGDRALDVATGTGPMVRCAVPRLGPDGLAVGLDVSREGLLLARAAGGQNSHQVQWIQAEALPLPFRDGCFDCVLVSFAFRHLGPPDCVLRELRRILVPGGRLAILDFLRPRRGPAESAGLAYLRWIVPAIAGLVSGRLAVYRLARYLPQPISDALRPGQLARKIRAAQFTVEVEQALSMGIVWLFGARAIGSRRERTDGHDLRSGEPYRMEQAA